MQRPAEDHLLAEHIDGILEDRDGSLGGRPATRIGPIRSSPRRGAFRPDADIPRCDPITFVALILLIAGFPPLDWGAAGLSRPESTRAVRPAGARSHVPDSASSMRVAGAADHGSFRQNRTGTLD